MPLVKTNGIDIYYEEIGQGPPLVLLMGLGADGSAWEDHVKTYEKHFRCILVDNRGAGRSCKPEGPYTTKVMSEDTIGLMDALGIDEAHISGISMGSAIAQELALNYPKRVRSLTMNCPWAKCDHYATRIFETLRSMIATSDPSAFTRLIQLIIFTPAYHNHHLDDLQRREEKGRSQSYPMPIHAFQAQCDACIRHDTRGRLHRIDVPTLITVGERDIFTPYHFAKSIAEEIKQAELLVFEGSGHTHHWENLDFFNRKTVEFLLRNN